MGWKGGVFGVWAALVVKLGSRSFVTAAASLMLAGRGPGAWQRTRRRAERKVERFARVMLAELPAPLPGHFRHEKRPDITHEHQAPPPTPSLFTLPHGRLETQTPALQRINAFFAVRRGNPRSLFPSSFPHPRFSSYIAPSINSGRSLFPYFPAH